MMADKGDYGELRQQRLSALKSDVYEVMKALVEDFHCPAGTNYKSYNINRAKMLIAEIDGEL